WRRASWLVVFLLPLLWGVPFTGVQAITIERIVAKINDDIITLSELQDFVKGEVSKLRDKFNGTKLTSRLRELELRGLDLLIERKLILQRAKALKTGVSAKELETAIGVVLKKNNIQVDDLDRRLRIQGLTPESFRDNVRETLLVRKVEGREVNFRISVSEEEVADYYKANIDQYRKGEARRVRQIFFPVDQKASKETDEEQRQKAEKALKAATGNGSPFQKVAEKLSEGPAAARGGDLGFIKRGEVFPEFEKILFSLPIGKVSNMVRTRAGYHVIKVVEERPGEVITLDRVSGRIRDRLFREKRTKRKREWLAELKRAAFLEINYDPQAASKKTGPLEALFREVREQVSFRLVKVQLLKGAELLGSERLYWAYGLNRREPRWKSERLKVDEELALGKEEISSLETLHREFVNPDPATHIFLYEHNFLLPNSYLGKVSLADLIKKFSLSPKQRQFAVVTDQKSARLEFEVNVQKIRSIVADPKEIRQ
ncbi:MAG: peptidylprolyl isomerase, partial [bacterium]